MKDNIISIGIEAKSHKILKYKDFKKYGFINFSIFEDGEEIDLSQYTATFFFKFPSKKIESMGGEITNNMVVLPLSDDFFNEKGDTTFEIAFTGKKQKVTTFKMYLRV